MNRLRLFLATLALMLNACASNAFRHVPAIPAPVQTAAFREGLSAVAMTPWTTGNSVRTLENGDTFFPAMLRAAYSARQSITFECFVGRDCPPVAVLSDILAERARAGVKAHVILDAVCCPKWRWGGQHIATMRQAGVQVEFYNPFRLSNPLAINHRTHRRVLVVDGRTGFCGGAGWDWAWMGHAEDSEHWRDTLYELHGPIVAQLQDNFGDNWRELTGTTLRGREYYPPLGKAGALRAQMVAGSSQKQRDTIGSSNLLAIRAARKSIVMEQSYFMPPPAITDALLAATVRGVHVRILLPGEITDVPFAKEVTPQTLRKLMNAGVELYEFQPTMMHGKLVVIDDHLVIAGSGNLDSRSFFINDENNLHVLNPKFAREQRRMFERDLTRSIRLTEETLRISPGRRLRGLLGQLVFGLL